MRVLLYVLFLALVFLGLAILLGFLDQLLSVLDYVDGMIEQWIAESDPSMVMNATEKLPHRLDEALTGVAPFTAFASMTTVFAYLARTGRR